MAMSKCGSCGSSLFEMVEHSNVIGSRFKLMFVQCASCGVPIGIMDYFNIGTRVQELDNRIKSVESTVNNIDNNIVKLANMVKRK